MNDGGTASSYRVLVIMDTIEIGGPGKGMLQFAASAPDSVDVTIANFAYPGRRQALFNEAARSAGIRLVELEQRSRLDTAPVRRLADDARREGIDLVQSHSFKAHLAAAWVRRRCSVPWLAFAHGWTAQDRRVRLYNAVERRLLRHADLLCVVSDKLAGEFRRHGIPNARLEVLHNAVERVESPADAPVDAPVALLVCIGRLSHEKGQDLLLDALATLGGLPWRLRIVGEGPERASLEARCRRLGLDDRVSFEGHVADVGRHLDEAVALVNPSRSEGIPNVVLEAFAHARAAIATRVGGVPDILDDGRAGLLCEPEVADLAVTIRRALSDPAALRRMGRHAWETLYPRFSPSVRTERIVAMHRSLIGTVGAE